MDKQEKPRLAEVLGVEVGERICIEYGAYTTRWFSLDDGNGLSDLPCKEIIYAINHPESIIRAPRLTEPEIAIMRAVGAKEEPVMREQKSGKIVKAAFPYGFIPTFHRYRLDEPVKMKEPQTIFVVSMGDLFGDWVPTSWIKDVFDACLAALWHTYMFLTKNPHRYVALDEMTLLPHGDNFWYGTTVTGDGDLARQLALPTSGVHTFLSVEPMLATIPLVTKPDLIIVGAETGNRKGKVTPERYWVDDLRETCMMYRIPVLWKDNIRKLFPDLPASAPMPGKS